MATPIIAGNPAEIRITYFSNTNLDSYGYNKLPGAVYCLTPELFPASVYTLCYTSEDLCD
jgi:hypothetical protein